MEQGVYVYSLDWVETEPHFVFVVFLHFMTLRFSHVQTCLMGRAVVQVENVEVLEDNHIKFDFLGKDSIRYENEVEVHPKVHKLVREFRARYAPDKKVAGALDSSSCLSNISCVAQYAPF